MGNTTDRHRTPRAPRARTRDDSPAAPTERGLDLGAVGRALWAGKWLVLTTVVVALAAIGVFLQTAKPRYEATTLISIKTDAAPLPGMESIESKRTVSYELGMLRNSGEITRRVLARLDAAPAAGAPGAGPGASADFYTRAQALLKRLKFEETRDGFISLTATSESPEQAVRLATLYAEAYQEVSLEERRASLRAARAFLEGQLDRQQGDLRMIEQRWAAFVRGQGAVPKGGRDALASDYSGVLEQLGQARLQLEQERLALQEVEADLARLGPGLSTAIASDLSSQIQMIEGRLAELKLRAEEYYATDPSLRGREASVPELDEVVTSVRHFEARKAALAEEIAEVTLTGDIADTGAGVTYAAGLRQRIEEGRLKIRQLELQTAALEGRADAIEAQLGGAPLQEVERERLERERSLTEEEYVEFVRQLQAIRVTEQAELGYVTIVREAYPPLEPVWPLPIQSLILGGLLGLFFGAGLAFARSTMRRRVRQPGDLAEHGFRLVGVVPPLDKEAAAVALESGVGGDGAPALGARSAKLLPLHRPWSFTAENYRLISTNLRHGDRGGAPRSILVTSPEASEGKTLTAVNLAVTMALGGQRTLLIGADLRRPAAHALLGMDRAPGLAEILEGRGEGTTLAPERLATGIERLSCLVAGNPTVPPPEMLGSPRMAELLSACRDAYDVVILDAPPVLVATDALLLARLCDATLVVVTAGHTSPSSLEAARGMLENVGATVTGTILNRFDGGSGGYNGVGYTHAYVEHDA